MGGVHQKLGDYEEAGRLFGSAVIAKPDYPAYLLKLANNLVFRGKFGEAERYFEQLINLQPADAFAHWCLSSARKATDARHIATLRTLVEHASADPRSLALLHYAIGKECEDLQDWDGAICGYLKGAEAHRSSIEFDEVAEIEMFDCLKEACTEEWLADGQGTDSAAPIFVVGEPRTGTTLIERMLASHSNIHSAGELKHFGLSLRRLGNRQDAKLLSRELIEASLGLEANKIGEMYLQVTKRLVGDAVHFVDKLPTNYLFIPFILKSFPKAKIIHLTRDPMDACFASFKQLFADAYLHSYDQAEAARHHARYRRLMNVYRSRFPGRFLDVSYESFVSDPEFSARAVFDYLELAWEDSCLEFHKHAGAVSTASAAQVREPPHIRSIGRWKKYEKYLQPMLQALRNENIAVNLN
jgi:tetratricopeptide (TPR) repeat protein